MCKKQIQIARYVVIRTYEKKFFIMHDNRMNQIDTKTAGRDY